MPFTPSRVAINEKHKTRVGQNVDKLEPLYTTDGNTQRCSRSENSPGGPPNGKRRVTMRPSNAAPQCVSKGKNTFTQKSARACPSSMIHNSQGAETAQTGTDGQTGKLHSHTRRMTCPHTLYDE